MITWFLPFIGHTGIGSSEGVLVRNLHILFLLLTLF